MHIDRRPQRRGTSLWERWEREILQGEVRRERGGGGREQTKEATTRGTAERSGPVRVEGGEHPRRQPPAVPAVAAPWPGTATSGADAEPVPASGGPASRRAVALPVLGEREGKRRAESAPGRPPPLRRRPARAGVGPVRRRLESEEAGPGPSVGGRHRTMVAPAWITEEARPRSGRRGVSPQPPQRHQTRAQNQGGQPRGKER